MNESRMMYSPAQAFWGNALLGGAPASVYYIAANYKALGKASEANRLQLWGYTFSLVLVVLLALSKQTGISSIIHLSVSFFALGFVKFGQLRLQKNGTPILCESFSTWQVVRIGLAFLLVSFLVIFLALVIASSLNGVP